MNNKEKEFLLCIIEEDKTNRPGLKSFCYHHFVSSGNRNVGMSVSFSLEQNDDIVREIKLAIVNAEILGYSTICFNFQPNDFDTKSKKYTMCEIESLKGVPGFYLYINDVAYGHYPLSKNHNCMEQIQMAIADAGDYGYDGIIFK